MVTGPRAEKTRDDYVAGILMGLSPAQASIHAGATQWYSRRLRKDPKVIAAITQARKNLLNKHEFTRDRAVQMLFEAREMAIVLEDPMAVIRAIDTLIKMHGFYAPEVHELRLSTDLTKRSRQIKELSDEKLLALAEQEELTTAIDVEFKELDPEALDLEAEEADDSEDNLSAP